MSNEKILKVVLKDTPNNRHLLEMVNLGIKLIFGGKWQGPDWLSMSDKYDGTIHIEGHLIK